VGLGVGTSLGLAVARALAAETGRPGLPAADLARRVGRGERSAVGVHGFDRGGLIVEAGALARGGPSPPPAPARRPAAPRARPRPAGAARGPANQGRRAFAAAAREPRPTTTDVLVRVALLGMLPAAAGGDLDTFGEAVYEFNRRAGEPFAAAQGGPYATAEI